MKRAIDWRKIHRWLGLIIGVQVLFWMASGFYFSLVPTQKIRGEHLTLEAEPLRMADLIGIQAPSAAADALVLSPAASLAGVSIQRLRGRVVYRLSFQEADQKVQRLVDAQTGEALSMLNEDEAIQRANESLKEQAVVLSVQRIDEHESGSEYRGRSLPIYRVDYEHSSGLRLYIDAWTGEVVARRTNAWRLFDFLWMLHIMDFKDRDNFNHPLLMTFALAGLLISISGYVLWWITSVFVKRRRSQENSA